MDARPRAARPLCRLAVHMTTAYLMVAGVHGSAAVSVQEEGRPARVRPWPCRLVVKPTLLGVLEDGWQRLPTLQRQCRELADAGAVVVLQWGPTDPQAQAVTRMRLAEDGVLVAHVSVPPVSDALVLVVHELEHVLERTRGVDFAAESKRHGSGVWQADGGFETQRAIDAGTRARKELREAARAPR